MANFAFPNSAALVDGLKGAQCKADITIHQLTALLAGLVLLFGAEAAHAIPVEGCSLGQPAPATQVPPEKFAQSPGGVDMRSGHYLYSHTDLTIGGDNGLTLTRVIDDKGRISHNWLITLEEDRVKNCLGDVPSEYDYVTSVKFGPLSQTFRAAPDSDFIMVSNGAWGELTFDPAPNGTFRPYRYTYRAADGTIVEFRISGISSGGGDECGSGKCVYASEVTKPDGTHYQLSYDNAPDSEARVRLRSVVSNRGYALLFEYAHVGEDGPDPFPADDWVVTKACALNLTVTTLPSISGEQVCPTGVPSSTYTYTAGRMSNFVDQGGIATKLDLGTTQWKFYNAGDATTPYLINSVATYQGGPLVQSQQFADGRTYTYDWDSDFPFGGSGIMGGSFIDNNGKTVEVRYGRYRMASTPTDAFVVTPGPELVKDEIGREITANYCENPPSGQYCSVTPPRRITQPEGNYREPTYDTRNNITHIRYVAKPGSGDPVRDEYWEFSCVAQPCQNKPTKHIDARGNTTDYEYSTVHGGLLKETRPADANGVRPQTRYIYAQRYAWIKAASGGYQQAATPIWVLTSEEHCTTSSATTSGGCTGGANDELTRNYDYGANSGPNNLLLLGEDETAYGWANRTCYTYDELGRRISETAPNAYLATCR